MGWILRITATMVIFVAGIIGSACIALYRVSKLQMD